MNEDVKSTGVHIHSRADELIACLEGEIAKRDARIVELEEEVLVERDSVKGYLGRINRLRAELSAIKAQEPVAYIPVDRETGEEWPPVLKKGSGNICDYKPLYAAPVSEAKAQDTVGEVVGWYRLDRPYEMTSYPSVCATWHRLGAPVAPLYAAPAAPSHGEHVREIKRLREAFTKMRNVAAGYSNHCEDSASTRRYEREFTAADDLFLSIVPSAGSQEQW